MFQHAWTRLQAYENSAVDRWYEESTLDLNRLKGAMHTELFGVHHLAKAARERSTHIKAASILKPQGRVETDSAVERRTDRDSRTKEALRRRQQHQSLVNELKTAQSSQAEGDPLEATEE